MTKEEHCQKGLTNPVYNLKITDCACAECGEPCDCIHKGATMCLECVKAELEDSVLDQIEKRVQNENMELLDMDIVTDKCWELLGMKVEFAIDGIVFPDVVVELDKLEKEDA